MQTESVAKMEKKCNAPPVRGDIKRRIFRSFFRLLKVSIRKIAHRCREG